MNFNKRITAKEIEKFLKIYKYRPIKDNKNGMKINHMFAFFFLLKKLKPKYVIESGVLKGQGTWLIEKTLPNAKIFSIDLDLSTRKYISKKVKYLDQDFKYFKEKIQPEKTLAFFDDHTCHFERLKQCKFFNIKQIVFEDNYDVGDGDFNSLKHILKKKSTKDHEVLEIFYDITRDLNNYDLELRIQELESKFSKDLSETTFNQLKELKKKQNIN